MFLLPHYKDHKRTTHGRSVQPTIPLLPNYTNLRRGTIPVDAHRPGLRLGLADSLGLGFASKHGLKTPSSDALDASPTSTAGCWSSFGLLSFLSRRGDVLERTKAESFEVKSGTRDRVIVPSGSPRPLPLESVLGRYQANSQSPCSTTAHVLDQVSALPAKEPESNANSLDSRFAFSFSISVKSFSTHPDNRLVHNAEVDSSPLTVTSSLVHSHDEILPPSSGARTPNEAWYEAPITEAKIINETGAPDVANAMPRMPFPSSSSSSSSSLLSALQSESDYGYASSYDRDHYWVPQPYDMGSRYSAGKHISAPEPEEVLKSRWSPFDDDDTREYADSLVRVGYTDEAEDHCLEREADDSRVGSSFTTVSDAISSSAFLSNLLLLPPISSTKARYPVVTAAGPPPPPPSTPNTFSHTSSRGNDTQPVILAPVPTKPGILRSAIEDLVKLVSEDDEHDDSDSEGADSCTDWDSDEYEAEDEAEENDEDDETILYMRSKSASDSKVVPSSSSFLSPSLPDFVFSSSRSFGGYTARHNAAAAGPFQPLVNATTRATSIWSLHATERRMYKR